MIKRFSSLALAAVLALALSAPATAATILVTSDSGQGYGTVTGTASGASFTSTTSVLNPTALNIINGSNLPLLPVYSLSLNETVTAFTQVIVAGQTIDVITAGTGSKTITSNGISVTLNFSLTSGIAQSGHFNTDATITSVTGSAAVGGPPPSRLPLLQLLRSATRSYVRRSRQGGL
jgi:opacity protein-like surface antigen